MAAVAHELLLLELFPLLDPELVLGDEQPAAKAYAKFSLFDLGAFTG